MVIFHSYVKLPEGNYKLISQLLVMYYTLLAIVMIKWLNNYNQFITIMITIAESQALPLSQGSFGRRKNGFRRKLKSAFSGCGLSNTQLCEYGYIQKNDFQHTERKVKVCIRSLFLLTPKYLRIL